MQLHGRQERGVDGDRAQLERVEQRLLHGNGHQPRVDPPCDTRICGRESTQCVLSRPQISGNQHLHASMMFDTFTFIDINDSWRHHCSESYWPSSWPTSAWQS